MSEGLARLAELEKAHRLRLCARSSRYNHVYSRDIDEMKEDYKIADEYENKARMLEEQ